MTVSINRYVTLDVETSILPPQNGGGVIEIGVIAIADQNTVMNSAAL